MRHRSIVHSSIAVVLLGLLMVGSSLATNARLAAPMAAEQSLVGSWRAVATPDQGPPLLSLGTAGADGTLVVSLPPVQPSPNAPGGVLYLSSGHGAWEATGADTAIASFVASLTDGSGNPAGTATVRVEITLGADGQTWSGTNEVTMADPAGNVVATMSATVEATRIVAEAPELSSPATPNASPRLNEGRPPGRRAGGLPEVPTCRAAARVVIQHAPRTWTNTPRLYPIRGMTEPHHRRTLDPGYRESPKE